MLYKTLKKVFRLHTRKSSIRPNVYFNSPNIGALNFKFENPSCNWGPVLLNVSYANLVCKSPAWKNEFASRRKTAIQIKNQTL